MERAIDRVWKRKLHDGQIDEATFKAESEYLLKALHASMGDPLTMKYTDTKLDTIQAMRSNVFTFVAFKGHSRISDIVNILQDDKGNLRSKSSFITEAKKISIDYNRTWLEAEYDTVVSSGQTAAQWKDFEKNADLLPFLIYKTQADSRVRDSHSVLHDVCKPIEDPFWDEFYPPNGWRCRCYVLQVAKQEGRKEPDSEPSIEEVKPIFRNNPGKTGVIFTKDHPYFAGLDPKVKTNVLLQMRQILSKEASLTDVVYKSESTGKRLEAHLTHTGHEREQNIITGKKIADQGYNFLLLAVNVDKKNPDGLFIDDNELAEIKQINGKWSVKNGIADALKKDPTLRRVVFDIHEYDRGSISSQTWEQFKRQKQLEEVWFLMEGHLYIIRRTNLKDDLHRLPLK